MPQPRLNDATPDQSFSRAVSKAFVDSQLVHRAAIRRGPWHPARRSTGGVLDQESPTDAMEEGNGFLLQESFATVKTEHLFFDPGKKLISSTSSNPVVRLARCLDSRPFRPWASLVFDVRFSRGSFNSPRTHCQRWIRRGACRPDGFAFGAFSRHHPLHLQ